MNVSNRHRREAMIRHVFALAILGAVATPVHAQDAVPDLKGTRTGKGKAIVFGSNAHRAGNIRPPACRACATLRRSMLWKVKTEGWSGAARPPRLPNQGTVCLGDCKRQQVDRRRRYGWLFPDYTSVARSHGEMLRAERGTPEPRGCRFVPAHG